MGAVLITVKIELWPWGDEKRAREIGRMYIANVGGTVERGDYDVAVCRRGTMEVPQPVDPEGPKATRSGEVKNYPRLSYNVWRLIARALLSAFPEERRGKHFNVEVAQDADKSDPLAGEDGRPDLTPAEVPEDDEVPLL